jgi:tRNA threonylcarbamoyl adenosine modification protein YeaZ
VITLAIETALSACSVAIFDGDRLLAHADETLGRGHAERLVPMVAEMMAAAGVARADAVAVDIGPGSFTGLRVGIAAARAFGLAWNAPVTGVESTALLAAGVFASHADLDRLAVAHDALRGEVYFQVMTRDGAASGIAAVPPAAAARMAAGLPVAGSGAALLTAQDGGLAVVDWPWPRARDLLAVPAGARARPPRPLYVRAPDAKLPA